MLRSPTSAKTSEFGLKSHMNCVDFPNRKRLRSARIRFPNSNRFPAFVKSRGSVRAASHPCKFRYPIRGAARPGNSNKLHGIKSRYYATPAHRSTNCPFSVTNIASCFFTYCCGAPIGHHRVMKRKGWAIFASFLQLQKIRINFVVAVFHV